MSQVTMPGVSSASGNDRINNIHTFLKGNNPLGLGEASAKAILALEEACGELMSSEQMKSQRSEHLPKLVKPKMSAMKMSPEAQQAKGFNANAVLIETFSTIRQLLHEGNIGELNNRLQLLNIESEALRQKGAELLDSFAGSTDQLKDIRDKVAEKQAQLKPLNFKSNDLANQRSKNEALLAGNEQNLTKLSTKLAENQTALAQLDSLPKPYTEEVYQREVMLEANITQISSDIEQITQQQKTLDSNITVFDNELSVLKNEISQLNSSLDSLLSDSIKVAAIADENRQKLNQFIETAPLQTNVDGEKWENTIALLTMLTAQLKKAMNEDSIRNMKEQEEVMMKINEASRKDSDKKAKEAAEAERKAADANKAASCASKVFSYIMLAVSVIATVATFGAAAPLTLAVAAIGIAMSIADIVLEETGQGSLMQMLAAEISSAVTDMLITFGVPEEEAKKIGSIVGMVLAAIAFLAISLLSMSSFVKNIANTVSNVTKMLAKNVGTLLKSAIKSMPKSLTNALGNIATKGVKAGQSVADSADDMVKLTKFTKLADKFDDVKDIAKSVTQAVDKVDKSSDFVSLGGQMVKVGNTAKLAKAADKLDDVKDIAKIADKATSGVKTQGVAMARVEVGMRGTGAALSVANAATTGGLRLEAAAQMRDMKEMLAGMMLNNETIQALTELLNALIKSMSKTYEQTDEMFSGMMTSLKQSNSNKVDMLKTARFA
ncbi:type III secretion system translocon subunit SctE [Providencia alcalifaciens]|uniref:type III secretion system translocon subunit SctE n=1 Tax=Providencia alcalifaciens TaxID=126385 RepID=UPI001CE13286|nr:type III secretion system translocon subunit SctE [Providencia alcalifaciens]UBX50526.1 type III secretion system translocon subunit SctE [Providencia alcalifaciens]